MPGFEYDDAMDDAPKLSEGDARFAKAALRLGLSKAIKNDFYGSYIQKNVKKFAKECGKIDEMANQDKTNQRMAAFEALIDKEVANQDKAKKA